MRRQLKTLPRMDDRAMNRPGNANLVTRQRGRDRRNKVKIKIKMGRDPRRLRVKDREGKIRERNGRVRTEAQEIDWPRAAMSDALDHLPEAGEKGETSVAEQ